MAWYNLNWVYRKKITIDCTKIDSDLSDFPVLVSITDSDLKKHAKSDCSDLVFTASDGTTKLKREIESYSSATGVLTVWVKISSISSGSDTVFYMYYGNPNGSETNNTGTWDSNYVSVWHLKDATTSTVADSTAAENTGTKTAANEPIEADAKISKGQSFDGSNDKISVPDSDSYSFTNKISISVWAKSTNIDTKNNKVITKDKEGVEREWIVQMRSDNNLEFDLWDTGNVIHQLVDSFDFTDNTWYYIECTYDGSVMRAYIDGQQRPTTTTATFNIKNGTRNVIMGWDEYGTANHQFNGLMDEVRVSNTNRSAAWIKANFNSTNNTLLSYGNEETILYQNFIL